MSRMPSHFLMNSPTANVNLEGNPSVSISFCSAERVQRDTVRPRSTTSLKGNPCLVPTALTPGDLDLVLAQLVTQLVTNLQTSLKTRQIFLFAA